MILVTEFFAVTLGQGIAAISPSIFIAASQNPFILVIGSLFCGVTVPYPNIPYFWRIWVGSRYNLNLFSDSLFTR